MTIKELKERCNVNSDNAEIEIRDGALTLVENGPRNMTDRIKTFEDACQWCEKHGRGGLALQYKDALNVGLQRSPDVIAYLKLRVITAALNEGWEPTREDSRYTAFYINSDGAVDVSGIDGYYCDSSVKLCFKRRYLAEYAAYQFKDIYADLCGLNGMDEL